MGNILITLKDGSQKEYQSGMTILDVAKDISAGLARMALVGEVDGVPKDLSFVLDKDCTLSLHTFDSEGIIGKNAYRHTTSHILAQAVKKLFPTTKLGIGPAIEDGFYYDFDSENPFTQEDLQKIETEMNAIIKADYLLERFVMPRAEAIKYMTELGEPYKIELIEDLPKDAEISFYKQGDFVDLCAGPHLLSTGQIKAVKLTQVAGAYWRGSEKNKMLQRIYGTSFPKRAALEEYIERIEEAKKRDHNKVGRELGYFMTSEVVGQGLPLFMPKGAKVLQILQRFVEDEEERRGYVATKTPFMAKSDLYKISGHWDHYRDGMFIMGDEEKGEDVMALRPMTCPFQFLIYNSSLHSYRDLPIRYSETSTLFRNESSGEMHGLIRLKQFTLSEGHIIARGDQVNEEFKATLELINYFMKVLGISEDIWYRFSKWDPANKEKYIDNPEAWEDTQSKIKQVIDEVGLTCDECEDEAAFYGPKLDIQFKNVHGKEDTIITIQIDFALPERFDMFYVDSDGSKKRPYVIHRSSVGCYERTLAMIIEKYAGALPTWLAPTQVKILPIVDKHHEYVKELEQKLKKLGLRAEADLRNEKVGYKIREAQLEKVPYMLIVGDNEIESNSVSVREKTEGDIGTMTVDEFVNKIQSEIAESIKV
jgi:threonyl-tRNA synthetase